MIWVIDKKVVPHLVEAHGRLAEVPLRVSFEYALEGRTVVNGSLSLKVLWNRAAVCRHFPQLDGASLDHAVNATAERAVDEHLAMSGFLRA